MDSVGVVIASIPSVRWLPGTIGTNLVLGVGPAARVDELMEREVAAGAVGGIAPGAPASCAEATVGESWRSCSPLNRGSESESWQPNSNIEGSQNT